MRIRCACSSFRIAMICQRTVHYYTHCPFEFVRCKVFLTVGYCIVGRRLSSFKVDSAVRFHLLANNAASVRLSVLKRPTDLGGMMK
jgi:hypothetical protein